MDRKILCELESVLLSVSSVQVWQKVAISRNRRKSGKIEALRGEKYIFACKYGGTYEERDPPRIIVVFSAPLFMEQNKNILGMISSQTFHQLDNASLSYGSSSLAT